MTACTHGFPTPLSCTECMWEGNVPPAPKPQHEWSRPFPARYDGVCRVCRDEIVMAANHWSTAIERMRT